MTQSYHDEIRALIKRVDELLPLQTGPIKLTAEQVAMLPRATPETHPYLSGRVGDMFGIPIVRVDRVEESTPYLLRHPARPRSRWERARDWFRGRKS